MTIRTFRPKQETTPSFTNGLQYDVKRVIALYGRHSRKEQNGNVATTQQTVGLEREALKMGFSPVLYRTFYEDLKGVSAYKVPMDERKSYSDLYNAIVRGEIGTVLCYLVDRLFRTKNGEEWELFINACAKNNVKVITAAHPMRIYDLSLSKDADDFRQKCINARTYIEEHVIGRMNAARDELGKMGVWAGQGVPIGFYIDFDETSSTYKQYLVYEPHAEIVRALFARFRELNGVFSKLMREVEAKQPLFPLFEGVSKLPNTRLSMTERGYTIGHAGLLSILTNPMYIGIYTYQDETIEDNHPVIVNHEDFFYAFIRLSRYDMQGNEKETARTRSQGYGSGEALLRGKLTSDVFTDSYVHFPRGIYVFEQKVRGYSMQGLRVPIETLDSVVSTRLVAMLQHWKNGQDVPAGLSLQELSKLPQDEDTAYIKYAKFPSEDDVYTLLRDFVPGGTTDPYSMFETVNNAPETVTASIDDQLPALKARIAKLRRNLDLDADEETLATWASELKQKVNDLARLEAKQKAIAESQSSQEEATTLMKCIPDEWEQMKFERKIRAIELFVEHVEVDEESMHFLRVSLAWKLPIEHRETLYIYRRSGTSYEWTQAEEALIREYYPTASVRDMLVLLPRRTWSTIKTQGISMGVRRRCGTPCDVSKTLSYEDMQFMRLHGIDSLDEEAPVQVFHKEERKAVSLSSSLPT